MLSRDAEINLYRIAQEALNNLVKHSGATEATVSIKRLAGGVRLTVADNGKGFDAQAALSPAGKAGFGLNGMAERVRLLKGTYAIDSTTGRGTVLGSRWAREETIMP